MEPAHETHGSNELDNSQHEGEGAGNLLRVMESRPAGSVSYYYLPPGPALILAPARPGTGPGILSQQSG